MRRNWQVLMLCGCLAVAVFFLGGVLFVRAERVSEDRLKERMRSLATLAALQFEGSALESIRGREDMGKTAFRESVRKLQEIRTLVPYIKYAYIMRRIADPATLEFVSDADALQTPSEQDRDGDGAIGPDEELTLPGDLYDAAPYPAMLEAFTHPSADAQLTVDQWGSVMSGYAPIRRKDGVVVAIVGLDMDASDYLAISRSILSPGAFLLFAAGLVLLAGGAILSFFHRRFQEWRRLDAERVGLMLLTYHQLGEPLSIFKWSLESLLDRESGQSAEAAIAAHAGNMEAGIQRMDQMISDLKQAAEVQEGRVDFDPKPGDLKDAVAAIVDDFREVAGRRHQTVELTATRLPTVFDERLVRSSLWQLLLNASHFSKDEARIVVRLERVGSEARISVQDFGAGISAPDRERLFEKFTRGAAAGRVQPDGNGLGLFIARGYAERARGHIAVESAVGKGSTFTVTLPLRPLTAAD